MMITFDDIFKNEQIRTYIKKGNQVLGVLGYTEHGDAHAMKVATSAQDFLCQLGYDKRTCELAKIAGYMHDIGNIVNRNLHALTGATLAFSILSEMGMDPNEKADIVGAIGNHDEGTGSPISPISAALILADKSDVRRSRVRNTDIALFDIHDRVNYAVEDSRVTLDVDTRKIYLNLTLDTSICSAADYFEIFLSRMLLCKKAAEYLNTTFSLSMNQVTLL